MNITDLVISWKPVENLASYIVYVEQEDLDISVSAKLPGNAASFPVPNGFLFPGTEYKMGVGTLTEEGNTTYVEATFTTAGAE